MVITGLDLATPGKYMYRRDCPTGRSFGGFLWLSQAGAGGQQGASEWDAANVLPDSVGLPHEY